MLYIPYIKSGNMVAKIYSLSNSKLMLTLCLPVSDTAMTEMEGHPMPVYFQVLTKEINVFFMVFTITVLFPHLGCVHTSVSPILLHGEMNINLIFISFGLNKTHYSY